MGKQIEDDEEYIEKDKKEKLETKEQIQNFITKKVMKLNPDLVIGWINTDEFKLKKDTKRYKLFI